jgi:hypothetical protein
VTTVLGSRCDLYTTCIQPAAPASHIKEAAAASGWQIQVMLGALLCGELWRAWMVFRLLRTIRICTPCLRVDKHAQSSPCVTILQLHLLRRVCDGGCLAVNSACMHPKTKQPYQTP